MREERARSQVRERRRPRILPPEESAPPHAGARFASAPESAPLAAGSSRIPQAQLRKSHPQTPRNARMTPFRRDADVP